MSFLNKQQPTFLFLFIGKYIIPIIATIILLFFGIQEYNFTGILALPTFGIYARILATVMLFWFIRILHQRFINSFIDKIFLSLYVMFGLLGIWTIYVEGTISATLHLAFSYSAFLCFNYLLLKAYIYQPKELKKYLFGCIACILLCTLESKISGSCELLYTYIICNRCFCLKKN